MERVTLRVVRGAPDPRETAALAAVLTAALGRVLDRGAPGAPQPRPVWRPFTGHRGGGWGRP
jgi:hypothetical protein